MAEITGNWIPVGSGDSTLTLERIELYSSSWCHNLENADSVVAAPNSGPLLTFLELVKFV